MFHIIAATDRNWGISTNGSIPWDSPFDRKFFREKTIGRVVIMGRKTFASIPKPLTNRINIVISNTLVPTELPDGVLLFSNPESCVRYCLQAFKDKICWVIGGQDIYAWFTRNHLISGGYLTIIRGEYNCDRFLWLCGNLNTKLIYERQVPGQDILCRIKNTMVVPDDNIANIYELIPVKNTADIDFLQIANEILTKGSPKPDRTQTGTLSLFGAHMSFDLSGHAFPLLTTRKMFLRGIFEELMLYIRGQTDSKILEEKKISVWKANTTREFLDARGLQQLPVGDMGPSYGFLFRHFGAEYKTCADSYTGQGIDQLANLIHGLKTNPFGRRHIISLWDPAVVDKCPLPPCLYNYQFNVSKAQPDYKVFMSGHQLGHNAPTYTLTEPLEHAFTLDCMMTQRSSDFAVAGGWNIATGALLTILLAKVLDMNPGKLHWNIGDVHLYNNVLAGIQEQLKRTASQMPCLFVNKKESIEAFEFSDLLLINYKPQPAIDFPMNA